MRIDLRNTRREKLFTVEVDPENPPTVVRGEPEGRSISDETSQSNTHAVHLNWDRVFDDEKHLRRCPVCGCEDLYARHQFPRLTAFVMIALAAVVAIVMLGLGELSYALIVLGVVGLVDVGVYLFFSGKVVVCYRCRSEFRDIPISRGVHPWQAEVEERYRPAKG
ncbi:MAG: hypothetical protein Kow00105_09690 [Phycisphaeraceae bacterium]